MSNLVSPKNIVTIFGKFTICNKFSLEYKLFQLLSIEIQFGHISMLVKFYVKTKSGFEDIELFVLAGCYEKFELNFKGLRSSKRVTNFAWDGASQLEL